MQLWASTGRTRFSKNSSGDCAEADPAGASVPSKASSSAPKKPEMPRLTFGLIERTPSTPDAYLTKRDTSLS